jgi:hypothetical protein
MAKTAVAVDTGVSAKAAPSAAQLATPKRPYQLHPKRMTLNYAGQMRNDWHATIEADFDFMSFMQPSFWAHVSKKLKISDHVEIINDEMNRQCTVIVLDASENSARVSVLGSVNEIETVTDRDAVDGYSVEYKGPHLKFCVFRKRDGARVKEGCPSEVEAQTWAITNRRLNAA